jgi:TonB family protein
MTLSTKERPESDSQVKPPKSSSNSAVNSGGMADLNPRSNPVCLEVGVTIRSMPGANAAIPGAPLPVREESKTVIVFDNGAVLRLSQNLHPGQTILLVNAQGREVVCKIVSTRKLPNIKGYVEVEFAETASDFWGIHQKPESRIEAPSGVSASASRTLPSLDPAHNAPNVPMKPAIPTVASIAGSTPGPTLVPAGVNDPAKVKTVSSPSDGAPTFEDISELLPLSPRISPETKLRDSVTMPAPQVSLPHANTPKPITQLSKPTPPTQAATLASIEIAAETENAGPIPVEARSQPADFPSIGRMSPTLNAGDSAGASKFGKLPVPIIGAAAAVLVLVIGGGLFFMNRPSGQTPAAFANVAVQPDSTGVPAANAPRPLDVPQSVVNQAPSITPAVENQTPVAAQAVSAVSTNAAHEPVSTAVKDSLSSQKESPTKTQPEHAISARQPVPSLKLSVPTAPRRDLARLGEGAAPSIAESASNLHVGTSLPSSVRSENQPAAPQPVAVSSITAVASNPRLLSSTRTIYPQTAKMAKVQGTVVVALDIDERGNVSGAKVISGPTLLRTAAIDTVTQWKYQPAVLNGTPTRSQTSVSLDFKLN